MFPHLCTIDDKNSALSTKALMKSNYKSIRPVRRAKRNGYRRWKNDPVNRV